ncbi:MAG: valine--tRNA ligase [Deltaproteobacteria bacterium]|nr:MAG: valine--tRNA ligase [Deltaproteobacteria bacterium]
MTTENEKLLTKGYQFADVEQKWLAQWTAAESFKASMDDGKESYSIVIPPPNVTGVLHIGHALNNTLQDVLVRYKRMCGYNTLWLPGTDHAGIATQNVVERQLLAEGKTKDDLGREAFIEKVWEWKQDKGGNIVHQLKRLGASCDWGRERFTMDEGLSAAVREVFVRLYREGLIYKGDYIVNWCPRCHTALADDEVEHEETNGKLYHIRYPYADDSGYLVVATTRPETMLGDTAVAVHPEDERYRHLVGVGIRLPLTERIIPVVLDEHVDRAFGTGALKVTPSHDRDDYEIGLRHALPLLKVMDDKGIMNEAAGPYAGIDRFDCRKRIVGDLERLGFLEKCEDYEHAVGQCYRCKTVCEPTTSVQWFVSVKPLAEKAVAAVQEGRINIYPRNWYNTFYSWMDNIRDWCISRQLWWGHRIPAWTCEDCGEIVVDTVTPESCSKCASVRLVQETDVLDTWFSSALWPFSTMGWPEKTRELELFYPTSILVTSFDILFFWVARMMMMGLHFMDEIPFRDVYLHALVRDKDGKKMSKSTGNVIDPLVVMQQYGTDAMRFTLTAFAAQGREIKLDEERIEGYRHFINKIWNAARFALMHIGQCDEGVKEVIEDPAALPLVHRWILSRLASTTRQVRSALDEYRFNDVASVSYQFIWHEFCDWYLEWIKADLFSDNPLAKRQAQGVLFSVLETVLGLVHPIIPFISEEIWSALPGKRGLLMTSSYPELRPEWEDNKVDKQMDLLMGVMVGIRNIRSGKEVHPSLRLDAVVLCGEQRQVTLLQSQASAIVDMTRLGSLQVGSDIEPPENVATYIYKDIKILIPLQGVIDIETELAKLERQEKKIAAKHTQLAGKLANEKFLAKAPAQVIDKVRQEKSALDAKLLKIAEVRKNLQDKA